MEKNEIDNWYMIWDSENKWIQIGGVIDDYDIVTGPVEITRSPKQFQTFNKR